MQRSWRNFSEDSKQKKLDLSTLGAIFMAQRHWVENVEYVSSKVVEMKIERTLEWNWTLNVDSIKMSNGFNGNWFVFSVEGARELVNDLLLQHKCSQGNLLVYEK